MSNHLEMAMIQAVMTLKEQGWSDRRIARELGIDRATVRRHLMPADSKPASNPPPGSEAVESSNPATNPPPGLEGPEGLVSQLPTAIGVDGTDGLAQTGPPSKCEPYRALIEEKLAQGLNGRRIYQDLGGAQDGPSYDSIKRFMRHLRKTSVLPFRRMEVAPGQESQVDFGAGALVLSAAGKRRRTHVFRIVLSHSRKAHSEAVYRQTTDDFIACLENAFWHFGGVTRTVTIDNLRAAVQHPDWYDPELNPRLEAFCRHYGTVILPTKSYTPRHKGKVERGIDYVKENGLKGHAFTDLTHENRHLREWEKSVADTRIHGTTRQQVGKVFEQVERPALLPLPAERFPFFHEQLRMVHRDGHVEVNRAYYSVPAEYVGRQVWARWDSHLVKIFNNRRQQIAVHARQEPGRFATAPAHILREKTSAVEKGASWLLQQAALLGRQSEQWSQEMLQNRGIPGVRVLVGLLSLGRRYGGPAIDRACQIANSHQAYRLRAIRELLKRGGPEQESFEFIAAHPIIRELHEYDALVRASLGGSEPAIHEERS